MTTWCGIITKETTKCQAPNSSNITNGTQSVELRLVVKFNPASCSGVSESEKDRVVQSASATAHRRNATYDPFGARVPEFSLLVILLRLRSVVLILFFFTIYNISITFETFFLKICFKIDCTSIEVDSVYYFFLLCLLHVHIFI